MTNEKKNAPSPWMLLLAAIVVIAVWAGSGWLLYPDTEHRGTFGDMFGAVNSLFSGLAFAALVYTVWMQRTELALQREELSLTRVELQGQKAEMAEQNATLTLQRFENTFFELVKVHGQIVDGLVLGGIAGSPDSTSRRAFLRLRREFYDGYLTHESEIGEASKAEALEWIARDYAEFHSAYQWAIGHYFRHLYHIVKFVKGSEGVDQQRYVTFVRAQLSSHELSLLFYNGLSEYGREKFKPLIEEFSLLKGLPIDLLKAPSHAKLYAARAFG
ncbi:MAG: putative phage abortive infection protein [Moraxellaceae bacterium]|nr:putative phage abortive infection protein [Moraxellaceae bacterium]